MASQEEIVKWVKRYEQEGVKPIVVAHQRHPAGLRQK
jgi:hypothetical protein